MDRLGQTVQRGRPVSSVDAAKASDVLEHFINAGTLKTILGAYRNMCELLHLKPNVFPLFYPKLKANLNSWKAKALWKKIDGRANHKCYARGKVCPNTRVLIIGAGPCGLRTAIEAQLLGAKVVVIEKRDRMSRNNVLHLWPFVIEDLRALGAKKFFGKFCAGAIDHISIRQLQCILMKAALLIGVEIYTEVSFERLIEPDSTEKIGWRAEFKPSDHPVSQYEFDVIIGADGKRNTLQGFKRKEFRGKLAIAITANFINKRTEAEARVEEISGVAFIFNQKFFKELNAETGIDLENIVYYKDDTHYFVMTAKKLSLIDKGVIKQDYADTARLLSPDNVDREALMNYAREAADFSTNYQMSDMEFAVNHYGQPDVAMFDFTSMYAADNASKVIERHGYKLLMILVGDSLLEPFWPTGSGCARGFLSALDACWAIKAWGSGVTTPLEVLAERESIYRLLAQTTPENLNKDWKAYTVDPSTRYPNLNKAALLPQQVLSLYDTDDPSGIELTSRVPQQLPISTTESHRKRRRRDMHLDPNTLTSWIKEQIREYEELVVEDVTTSFKDGRVLCAILHHYRPDLVDYSAIKAEDVSKNNQLAFDLLEKEIGISPVMTGEDMAKAEVPDYLTMFSYLTQIYDTFRGEIPHIKHPKLISLSPPPPSSPAPKRFRPLQNYRTKPLARKLSRIKSLKRKNAERVASNPIVKPKLMQITLSTRSKLTNEVLLDINRASNILNLTPVKSFEEYSETEKQSFNFIEQIKNMTFSNHSRKCKCKVNLDKIKSIGNWVQSVTELTTIVPEQNDVRYFDENFREISVISEDTSAADENIIVRCYDEDHDTISMQELKFCCMSNTLSVHPPEWCSKTTNQVPVKNKPTSKNSCQFLDVDKFKFLCLTSMSAETEVVPAELTYDRIVQWLNETDCGEAVKETDDLLEALTDLTSVTKEPLQTTSASIDSIGNLVQKLKSSSFVKFSKITPWARLTNKLQSSEPPLHEELDLPEPKEASKDVGCASVRAVETNAAVLSRYTNRAKRHAEPISTSKPALPPERRTKKRRSFEKYDMGGVEERRKRLEDIAANRADRQNKRRQQRRMQTEQFVKSMQMLHMNAKPDASGPFEDYSIFVYRQTAPHFQDRVKNLEKKFTYVPDREGRTPSQSKGGGGADEEFAARIKDLEDKWRDPVPIDKKPKDLLRAIGKIETSDWNIKEIEKKIMENKLGKSVNKEKERVPKWNREQFLARQTKMEKQHLDRQNSCEAKFSEVDKSIKHLEQRLKEGSVRDLGQNKVASITQKLKPKSAEPEPKPVVIQKSNPKPAAVVLPTQGGSEYCHFCQKRVYLMERLSAEGRFFHRGCFKCQYCHTTLRLGSYMFDRDGHYGHRFYCSQHFGMPGELYADRIEKKVVEKLEKENIKPLEKLKIIPLTGVEGVDLLDRVQTPERIEFANLSAGHISSDHDESLSQMDEDEWTDRNFGASTAEVCSSDEEESSSLSGSESDNEDAYEEALEEPPTKEGTMRWMERYKQRYSKERRAADDSDSEDYSSSSDHSSYYENSSGDEEDEPATEGEEEIRARELRKQEVRVEPPVVQTDTGSDTEIVSDESSPESSSKHNSATEISTDSEFAVDEPTPTREIPSIVFNDFNVTKTRGGGYGPPKKVQVKSGVLQSPVNGKAHKRGIQLEFTPLVPSPVLPKPAPTSLLARTEGYALNRTQSTGGIAAKVSLELKKKYLLGDNGVPGSIQKSGSVSTLDSKFKSFHTNISDCQKLLKPAQEISPSMKVFCNKLNERRSPLSPITSQSLPFSDKSPDVVGPKSPEIVDLTISPEPPDITKCTKEASTETEASKPFEHELEGRPRSPVQEIPIIVPKIDWNQTNRTKDSDISSDSLTSDTDSEEHTGIQKSPTVKKIFESIPRVEVRDDAGEILGNSGDETVLDSLCAEPTRQTPPSIDAPKSIATEKKRLNQPKTLPGLQSDHVHAPLEPVSGNSTPSDHDSCVEHTTAAMTETELSDWAHDGMSDDFEDVPFDLNPTRRNRPPKGVKQARADDNIKANLDEFDDLGHVCGKERQIKNEISLTENLSNILSSIEFMDTGEETSSDEKVLVEATMRNNGYVVFQNEDDIAEDSLNPRINDIIETINPEIRGVLELDNLSSRQKNTGYCIIGGGDLDVERPKLKQSVCENEDDSLLIVETGTTTEENTCSDSTVKNLEKKDVLDVVSLVSENKTMIDKIHDEQKVTNEYREHCQRLQSKVEFGNVRDSIDIRKSKRKDKVELPPKPDLIREEAPSPIQVEAMPKIIYTKEEIKKVRDENQRLVQEMVMNKMKAQNRSLERKRRSRNSFSPSLSPSRPPCEPPSVCSTPDVVLTTKTYNPLEKSRTTPAIAELNAKETPISLMKQHPKSFAKQLSVHAPDVPEALSLPDIQQALQVDEFMTPKPPPRQKCDELRRTAEKLKQDARAKARLKSNEDLGLSPEDKLRLLREKIGVREKDVHVQDSIESLVINTERRNSLLYANDTLTKKRNGSFKRSKSGDDAFSSGDLKLSVSRTKSVSEISKPFNAKLMEVDSNCIDKEKQQFCKSDPNLLTETCEKVGKKKSKCKDRERRKSITKLISEFFGKKKEGGAKSSSAKGFLARISPKSKSKSMINLAGKNADKIVEEITRTNSFSEAQRCRRIDNASPPPIPPLPLNYTGSGPSRCTDDSSDGEAEWRRQERSSCDTLDQSGIHEGRRGSRSVRKAGRQAQLKRHRMAQEIQRKLEETEVKTREFEQRGVSVEKALRGESSESRDECELLKEWFDLMRDLTELRRYERELMVRAKELELEDRHARLQQELRERLESDDHKTKEDAKAESSIINEMMEIVAKRDSFIALQEQDRLRYSEEDRDFEEQMLAKGLRLTPLKKVPEK